MNHLYAKLRRRDGEILKVLSNKEIFSIPEDADNLKEYEATYKLEEDEWFVIKDFSSQDYFLEFLGSKINSTDYDQIEISQYNLIHYLFSVQDDKVIFQKFSSGQFLKKKWFTLSSSPRLMDNEPIIVINSYCDAIYDIKKDQLIFRSLGAISTIFPGISELYKEATNEETEVFLQSDFISLNDDYDSNSVKTANRKRIALAQDAMSKLSKKERIEMIKYVRPYCKKVKYDSKEKTFKITTEEDLKQVLYGILQRYYTTPFGNERRLANSVTVLK